MSHMVGCDAWFEENTWRVRHSKASRGTITISVEARAALVPGTGWWGASIRRPIHSALLPARERWRSVHATPCAVTRVPAIALARGRAEATRREVGTPLALDGTIVAAARRGGRGAPCAAEGAFALPRRGAARARAGSFSQSRGGVAWRRALESRGGARWRGGRVEAPSGRGAAASSWARSGGETTAGARRGTREASRCEETSSPPATPPVSCLGGSAASAHPALLPSPRQTRRQRAAEADATPRSAHLSPPPTCRRPAEARASAPSGRGARLP
eukprot:CAMPEP_0195593458 /NCGR_PEP_ID=MMETSP0815-20121206/897_1 /TAXON_ID=97485 /ORGANISM="Prymnesium parvum, Strain Texoma1" /LENGTH=273 /DNA_ID=CAMNT_0040732603 /DNA_START=391 /DNA_END=1209 /DNA_ORIENTATION=+